MADIQILTKFLLSAKANWALLLSDRAMPYPAFGSTSGAKSAGGGPEIN
jgi:hypothetical protein